MAIRDESYYMARLQALDQRTDLVGVNLGGAGEVQGYTNVNNLLDQRHPGAIGRLIRDRAENVVQYFAVDSVDHVVANNIVPGTFDWNRVAAAVFRILRPGGLVSLAEFAGGYDRGQSIKAALERAGFRDVVIIRNVLVAAEK